MPVQDADVPVQDSDVPEQDAGVPEQDADVPVHHLVRSSWSSSEQQHREHVLSGIIMLSIQNAPI